ncbi:sodium:solute symporter family protein [Halarchaeum nitratireducens]|uniref:sodium:solute symporter family protein n=1 Tax=Halarchaeum nitratireducens TaxID=489913 RepID=UPI001E48C979|nr:sodium:solute symporter family protein [Halarchaeum nitratireducens]
MDLVTPIVIGLIGIVAVMLGVGFYVSRKVKGDSVNYIVAGRGLILPLAAATLMAQSLDSNATLGNTDLVASAGFWAGAALPVGLATCLFLTGLFFAKPMNRMNLVTLPDFYRRKYGRVVEVLSSGVMLLAYAFLLAGNLVAGGYLFQIFLGFDYTIGVVAIAAIIFSYTVAGGLFSVAYTDVIQAGIALVGSLALIVYVATNYGITVPSGMGPTAFGQLTNPAQGAYINWASIIALGLGDIVAIDFMERVFAADDPETAQKACFIGSAGTLIIGIPFSVVALSMPSILSSIGVQSGSEAMLYTLLQTGVPTWLAILVLGGIVAASFSTGDGAILGTSAVLARNVVGIRVDENAPDDEHEAADADDDLVDTDADKLLTTTRIMAVPVTVLGVFFALQVAQTGMLLLLAFDVMLAALLVPFVFGLFKPDFATRQAALASILAGSLTRLVLFALVPTTYAIPNSLLYIQNPWFTPAFDGLPTFIAPALALVTYVGVAAVTEDAEVERTSRARTTAAEPTDD